METQIEFWEVRSHLTGVGCLFELFAIQSLKNEKNARRTGWEKIQLVKDSAEECFFLWKTGRATKQRNACRRQKFILKT